jgi:hypothetical protein
MYSDEERRRQLEHEELMAQLQRNNQPGPLEQMIIGGVAGYLIAAFVVPILLFFVLVGFVMVCLAPKLMLAVAVIVALVYGVRQRRAKRNMPRRNPASPQRENTPASVVVEAPKPKRDADEVLAELRRQCYEAAKPRWETQARQRNIDLAVRGYKSIHEDAKRRQQRQAAKKKAPAKKAAGG